LSGPLNVTALIDSLLYFCLLGLAFGPLERAFASRNQPFFRAEWFTDFLFFLGGNLIWTRLTLWILSALSAFFTGAGLVKLQSTFGALPLFLQCLLVVFLSDFLIYWGHRLSHRLDFLWRFHAVHHSARQLDWLAAFREHPLDNIYTRLIVNLPALVLGLPLEVIGSFILFRGLWGNFIHSNSDLPLGPLQFLLGSPRLHHWHHDQERNGSCNFGNLNPLLDLLFGTYYDPGRMPLRYGYSGNPGGGYLSQILSPLGVNIGRHLDGQGRA